MTTRVSIVIPALDERARIEGTLRSILDLGERELEACEVILVDDGSQDGTAEHAAQVFGDRIRVLRHDTCRGKGAAVRTGVLAASEPWILFVDADLAVPIEELPRFLEAASGAPIVIGSKRIPGSSVLQPGLRRLGGKVGHALISLFAVRGFHDTQCGFKLFSAAAAHRLFEHSRLNGFGFDFEILYLARRAGFPVVELPVQRDNMHAGSVSLKSYLSVLGELASLMLGRLTGRYRGV